MTERKVENASDSPSPRPAWRARLSKILSTMQFLLAVAVTAGFALYLFLFPHGIGKHEAEAPRPKPNDVVTIVGPRKITIQSGSEFEQKLEFTEIHQAEITTPLLTVAGT